ncbi:DUF6478 family protein [Yoonia sp. 2307UL14-13]|uniref:DUF6478 family protein n=1 Tax=Yoonia sp. 2307UL14-13 TaxID=3126506 RepID=UPI00309DFECA
MAINPDGLIGRMLHQRALRRWQAAARAAVTADLSALRAQRQQARQLRNPLRELTYIANDRLALPRIGTNTFPRPAGTDWAWRPQLWRGALPERGIAPALNKQRLGPDLGVFHDCPANEISLRQVRNTRDDDLAAFGVTVEVFQFDGSFLSLVLDLPQGACTGLQRRHLIRLTTALDRERPIRLYTRLNVKHGPNTEQILLSLPETTDEGHVEFDLAYSQLNEKRAEKMWIDLIFENPAMNRITLRDLNICRFPRAEV